MFASSGGSVDREVAALDTRLERATEHRQARRDGSAEAEHRTLGDLVEQLGPGTPHQAVCAVDERRMLDAVVDECGDDRRELVARLLLGLGGLGQSRTKLVEVAHEGEGEQLLLAGEVPIDDRPVDPDGPGDVLDLCLGHTALIEQRAGRDEDRRLPGTPAYGGRRTPGFGLLRALRARHARIVRPLQLRVAQL